jgi:hypothetical protein
METKGVLAEIDAEIQRLESARALLVGNTKEGGHGKKAATSTSKKRRLSPEARARIAAAQKARWAKVRKAAK